MRNSSYKSPVLPVYMMMFQCLIIVMHGEDNVAKTPGMDQHPLELFFNVLLPRDLLILCMARSTQNSTCFSSPFKGFV